ncbi:MAG: DUF4317 domain-containing protein [Oscillospiraceae bacterium]|nr:DUF4317 domain-containing protein [Oscillospiraceae bacterium]
MIEKEVAEIRRRFSPKYNNPTLIRGCYVNEKREIITEFDRTPAMLPQEESEKYLALLKKSLSGTLQKNLIDITFSTAQVADSDEHRLLTALKNSGLKDDEAVSAFFNRVIQSLNIEGNYLILLSHDKYDVPYRSGSGDRIDDASDEVFSYIVCSVCPVKESKPALSYSDFDGEFHSRMAQWVVASPEVGFMFPCFDDRATNIYNALYYSKDSAESHEEFAQAIFNTELPAPAAEQKENFEALLAESLGDECDLLTVQNVNDGVRQMIAAHKENKIEEQLLITKREIADILDDSGVSPEKVEAFEERFEEVFGEDAAVRPRNIVETKQLQVTLPDVVIKVNPERSDLIETRVINGCRYIMIRANEGVEVNGVAIKINDDSEVTV